MKHKAQYNRLLKKYGKFGNQFRKQVDNYKEILRGLHIKRGSTVLEIGAGNGLFSHFLASYYGCTVYSMDEYEGHGSGKETYEMNNQLLDGMGYDSVKIVKADFEKFRTRVKFDYVFAVNVFHHIVMTKKHLSQDGKSMDRSVRLITMIKDMLRSNGVFILREVEKTNLPFNPMYWKMRTIIDWQTKQNSTEWKRAISSAGLRKIRIRHLTPRIIRKIPGMRQLFTSRLVSILFDSSYVIYASKLLLNREVLYDDSNGRLEYFDKKADSKYWSNHWDTIGFKRETTHAINHNINSVVKRYATKQSRILEAGSGNGNVVYSIDSIGYQVQGVDYAQKTVKKVKKIFPHLNITCQDITKLDFPDNHFDMYLSLGLFEHFREGYDKPLKEMIRVLKPGGYAVISFPYMSPFRKRKARQGHYPSRLTNTELQFYQYALDHERVVRDFSKHGLRLVETIKRPALAGFKDDTDTNLFRRLDSYRGGNILIKSFRKLIKLLSTPYTSHSIMLVLRAPSGTSRSRTKSV